MFFSFTMATVRADFETDWTAALRAELALLGYAVPPTDSARDLAIKLCNAKKRRVSASPRAVHVSRELNVPSGYEAGYEEVKKKLVDGDDITANLSTRIVKVKFNDGLLNDWAIHHFHLGTTTDPSNPAFVTRTDPVLLAHITDDAAYLVDVVPHQQWTDQRYLQIMKANWPELFESVAVNGNVRTALSNVEIEQLRKAGINTILDTGANSSLPLGGGYTTTGAAGDAAWYATKGISILRRFQKEVMKAADEIALTLADAGVPVTEPIILQARFQSGRVLAVEHVSQTVVRFMDFPELAG